MANCPCPGRLVVNGEKMIKNIELIESIDFCFIMDGRVKEK